MYRYAALQARAAQIDLDTMRSWIIRDSDGAIVGEVGRPKVMYDFRRMFSDRDGEPSFGNYSFGCFTKCPIRDLSRNIINNLRALLGADRSYTL